MNDGYERMCALHARQARRSQEEQDEQAMEDGLAFARRRLDVAREQVRMNRWSLVALRSLQVAQDELRDMLRARRDASEAHSVQELRQLDLGGARRLVRR